MSVEISDDDDEVADDHSEHTTPPTPEPRKPLLFCSPFSWTNKEYVGMLTKGEKEAAIIMERETDCLELYIKSVLYAEWCNAKRELVDGSILLACEPSRFRTVMEDFTKPSTDYEKNVLTELLDRAEHECADGVLPLEPFFSLIDTPFGTHEIATAWSRRCISYVKSVTHKRYNALHANLVQAFRKGNYNTDSDGAILPANIIWDALEAIGVHLGANHRKSLCHRYTSFSGRPEMHMMKSDALLSALEVVASITDIWNFKELLGSITHRCSRDLYSQAQNLPFPPRCLVNRGIGLDSCSLPSPNCTPRAAASESVARGWWSPDKRMSNNPMMTNAAKGDVLAFPNRYNLHHRVVQDQHEKIFLNACKEYDTANTQHVSIEDLSSVLLHKFLAGLPEVCLTTLSILYNDSDTPKMVKYTDLLHDICRNETAYADIGEPPILHNECCQLIALLYKKWNIRGRPDICAGDNSATLRPPEVIQKRIADLLGVHIPPKILAVFMWHIAEPETVPFRRYALPPLPPTGKELREVFRQPQALQGSFGTLHEMLTVLDEVVWEEGSNY